MISNKSGRIIDRFTLIRRSELPKAIHYNERSQSIGEGYSNS